MLERFFGLSAAGTDVRTEVLAGFTTFLTMAYITVVNPAILAEAGLDFGAVFVATCLAAALGSALMGLVANHPVALAPGMGLNAYFTYSVVLGAGVPWQTALGAVFLSGVAFLALSLLPVRRWLVHAVPRSLQLAVSSGIGLFLALIALENSGLVVDHPVTLVSLGDLTAAPAALALAGAALLPALVALEVPGALSVGMLGITAVGVAFGVSPFYGVVAAPPSLAPTFWQLDVVGALDVALIPVVLAFLFVDLFDTTGTLLGVAHQGKLFNRRGRFPRLGRALLADSVATVGGALLGTSTTTSFVESAAGIQAGGRTGLTAVIVALLFLLALPFAPLAQTVPTYATAPALLFVAALMMRSVVDIDWDDPTEFAPAVMTVLAVPFTYSIAHGIGVGFLMYVGAKLVSGRPDECPVAVYLVAAAFLGKVLWL